MDENTKRNDNYEKVIQENNFKDKKHLAVLTYEKYLLTITFTNKLQSLLLQYEIQLIMVHCALFLNAFDDLFQDIFLPGR